MIIDTKNLLKDEATYLELMGLYENSGYSLFKMRKFEEYSLYLDNKNFLGSESVLTFNGAGGRLLALKPDVTLSIVKNTKAAKNQTEKLYYRESVYRMERGSDFKEINQMGLECIGEIGFKDMLEICSLAVRSLECIDTEYVFSVSHMSFIMGLMDECGIASLAVRRQMVEFIRSKNAHDLYAVAGKEGISKADADRLAVLCSGETTFRKALAAAKAIVSGDEMRAALAELTQLYEKLSESGLGDRVRLDFSIINDIDYYNGIIFQGYVQKMPKTILSGGRYDGLLAKFGKDAQAMGFALSLSELPMYYPREKVKK